MPGNANRPPAYRFGLFEVFPDAGEIWKQGRRLKLQDQPFRLLLALLEKPGELISRDAIRERLWPGNTFVEFDQSLGTAVTKLRQTLGDEADNPRFIETVPKRGYRFLAPVTFAPASETESGAEVVAAPVATADPATGKSFTQESTVASPARKSGSWLAVALASVVALSIAAPLLYRHFHGSNHALHANDSIILSSIQNATGEAVFDATLSRAARVKLNESPYFNLVSDRALRAALEKAQRPASDQISADDARAACSALNAKAIVTGNVGARGGNYVVTLIAAPCSGGRSLATEQLVASSRDEVFSALGTATDRLRATLGEPPDSVKRFSTPLAEATTSSLAALQAFSAAEAKRDRGQDAEAIAGYKLATDLDPNFALAYSGLGVLLANANELAESTVDYQKAFDLREHTTERERLSITAHYYSNVQGDLDKTVEVYTLWRQLYPHDLVPPNNLADIYLQLGEAEKALASAHDAIEINPNNAFPRGNYAQAAQRLGQFDAAKQTIAEAQSRGLDFISFHMTLFQIAFAQNDEAEMARQVSLARDNPREGELLNLMAWSEAARGRLREARKYFHQAEAVSMKNGLTEFAADIAEDDGQIEVDFGFVPEGIAETDRALRLAPNEINVSAFASLIFARAGDLARAESYAGQVDKLGPHYTVFQKIVLPTARGAMELSRNDPKAAIDAMAPVEPNELSRLLEMCVIYYRAEAYLASHKNKDAAEQFQKLLDHSFVRPVSPYIALSHLGLARVFRAEGDPKGARVEYSRFLKMWEGADPDIPILRAARAEVAHL
jgi:DNA-binding winged helix-turn-helix (wHTH) protein/tetratricopeptide (TPR) repeat protein